MRSTGVLLCLLIATAHGDPCPPRDPAPIPPIPARPASKAALARSMQLVEASVDGNCEGKDPELAQTLAQLRAAIRTEPANIGARTALVLAIAQAMGDPPDPELTRWLATLLVQLRDAAWAGCRECQQFLADDRRYGDAWSGPKHDAFVTSVHRGPPGRLGDAARAVILGMVGDREDEHVDPAQAWAAAARYLDGGPIRLAEGENGSGGDPPVPSTKRSTLAGRRGLRKWLDHRAESDDMPGSGDTLFCSGRCCDMPFIDYHPHMYRLSRLCFDAGLHLRELATERSGM
jgi:hypothetical protein